MQAIFFAGDNQAIVFRILEVITQIFIELSNVYYDQIEIYMQKIAEFTFYLVILFN